MIVYSAGCSWWADTDSDDPLGRLPGFMVTEMRKDDVGLPCCPYCGCVLYQTETTAEEFIASSTANGVEPMEGRTIDQWRNWCNRKSELDPRLVSPA